MILACVGFGMIKILEAVNELIEHLHQDENISSDTVYICLLLNYLIHIIAVQKDQDETVHTYH